MLDTIHSLLAFAGIVLTAWTVGGPICRWLHRGHARADRWEYRVWRVALGLVACGLALTVWGMIGGLNAAVITWLTIGGVCVPACETISRALRGESVLPQRGVGIPACEDDEQGEPTNTFLSGLDSQAGMPTPVVARLALLAATLAAGAALVSALAPAVAGDALCYHLELPKRFLQRGEIAFFPDHENSTFPLLTEMWFVWALALDSAALDSAVTAQLVHWLLGLLLAAASVMLARPIIGRRAAWLVGLIVLTVPGVTNQMAAPLNDVALAAFTTLALVAWQRGIGWYVQNMDVIGMAAPRRDACIDHAVRFQAPHVPRESLPRWTVIAGVMAGAAMSIKYVALIFAVAAAVPVAWALLRRTGSRLALLRSAAVVSALAVAVSGVWYARAAYHRGNPVYPFFAGIAGTEGPPTVRDSKRPLRWNLADLVTSPWQVTVRPERFGGRGHQLGPLFLLTLPLWISLLRRRTLRPLIGMAVIYALIWYSLRQNVRFLLPLIGVLATLAAAAILSLRRLPTVPRLVGVRACAAAIVWGAIIPTYRARQHVAVALGLETRDAFLCRHEPAYRAAQFANDHLPADAHLLSQDYRAFYFKRNFTRENAFRQRTHFERALEPSAAELVPRLRSLGITHVLLAEGDGDTARYNGTLSRLIEAASASQPDCTRSLLSYQHHASDGSQRRYRLLELTPESSAPSEITKNPNGRSQVVRTMLVPPAFLGAMRERQGVLCCR